jgi:hypothetical protein
MIVNRAVQTHKSAQAAALLADRISPDHGIRDTIRYQMLRHNQTGQTVVNSTRTSRFPDVYCWCQTEIVRGTWDRIAAGLTESCGAPGCDEESSNFFHK